MSTPVIAEAERLSRCNSEHRVGCNRLHRFVVRLKPERHNCYLRNDVQSTLHRHLYAVRHTDTATAKFPNKLQVMGENVPDLVVPWITVNAAGVGMS